MKNEIFLTSLDKYTNGELCGAWVSLPCDIEDAKKKIDPAAEEWFITDYENDFGYTVGEYANIDELNELAEQLEDLNEYERDIFGALISEGYDIEEALNKIDDCIVYSGCYTMEDVAYEVVEECGYLDGAPDALRNYFDYKAFGRDLGFDGQFVETAAGIVEIL